MTKKLLFALSVWFLMSTASAYPQGTFPSTAGNDTTQSLGIFRIQIINKFATAFTGCAEYDKGTKKFTSPVLYDGATVIGRSVPGGESDQGPPAQVPTGLPPVTVGDQEMKAPAGFEPASGNREVHTDVRSLHMVNGGFSVRAGVWYNSSLSAGRSPGNVSPGEVFSDADRMSPPQTGNIQLDFPARSYFNVYVQVDIPKCGRLPSAITVYNRAPLIVHADGLQGFPPNVIYLHDTSTAVPIYISDQSSWGNGELVGYLLLAGHGIGPSVGNPSEANRQKFANLVLTRPEAQAPCDCAAEK